MMIRLTLFATGVVLTLSTRDSLIRFGAKSFLPAVVVFSIIKESGPIIAALVVSGRGYRGRIERDEGHRTGRRHGSLGRQSIQIPRRHACPGLHADAPIAHTCDRFLRYRDGMGRQYAH